MRSVAAVKFSTSFIKVIFFNPIFVLFLFTSYSPQFVSLFSLRLLKFKKPDQQYLVVCLYVYVLFILYNYTFRRHVHTSKGVEFSGDLC